MKTDLFARKLSELLEQSMVLDCSDVLNKDMVDSFLLQMPPLLENLEECYRGGKFTGCATKAIESIKNMVSKTHPDMRVKLMVEVEAAVNNVLALCK